MLNETHKSASQNERLLQEFKPHTKKEWREAVDKLLKGKSYDKIMLTKTYEGIVLDPIYWQEDIANLPNSSELPGYDNYTRGTKVLGNSKQGWSVSQEICVATPQEFNTELLHDLNRGQTTVNLPLDEATKIGLDADQANDEQVGKDGVSISILADLETALENVEISYIDINIEAYNSALAITAMLASLAKKKNIPFNELSGTIGMDPLAELAKEGTICLSLDQAYDEMYELIKWSSKNAPKLKSISIHTAPYHNAGASSTEELAFAFTTAIEYIREMQKRGLHINVIAKSISFNLSLGSNFFMEISKIRAARMMWSKIIGEFGGNDEAAKMYIHAKTSAYNKTQYDPYVNMLRSTTEAFSGIIGGVDSLQVEPFDKELRQPDRFSRRIARNQQIILNEECHLGHVIDPAGGSWYIESLTSKLADKVWEKLQDIESEGGMFACLENNKAQEILAKVEATRKKNLFVRRDTIVGTNMYANMSEAEFATRDLDLHEIYRARKIELSKLKIHFDVTLNKNNIFGSMIEAFSRGASLGVITNAMREDDDEWPTVTPVHTHRISEMFENIRNQVENYKIENGRPKCYLANLGNVSQYKGRSDFSRGFFEIAGFDVTESIGNEDPIQAAKEAIEADAPVIVICSSDKKYPEFVPKFAKLIKAEKPDAVLVLAGYPKDQIEEHKQNGVDVFIHARANSYEILSDILKKVGVIK